MRRLVIFLVACGGTGSSIAPTANPLGSTADILPYPSSLYERADAASPTGVRVDMPTGAIPAPDTGAVFDPTRMNARTGWPAATTILWAAPGGVDPTKLVGFTDLAASLGGDSSTVILDMTSSQRVAHFAEVDANETADFSRQAVYLRPTQRFASGHRIAVGIRKTVARSAA